MAKFLTFEQARERIQGLTREEYAALLADKTIVIVGNDRKVTDYGQVRTLIANARAWEVWSRSDLLANPRIFVVTAYDDVESPRVDLHVEGGEVESNEEKVLIIDTGVDASLIKVQEATYNNIKVPETVVNGLAC